MANGCEEVRVMLIVGIFVCFEEFVLFFDESNPNLPPQAAHFRSHPYEEGDCTVTE